jgi:lipoprotein-releasing system permease protein
MILGIVISVGILSAGLNLFEGYQRTLKSLLLDSIAHVSIFSSNSEYIPISEANRLKTVLQAHKEVTAAVPVITSSVMAQKAGAVRGCFLKAYDKNESTFSKYVVSGSPKLETDNIIIGYHLAKEFNLVVNDTLSIIFPQMNRITALGLYPSERQYSISGIYKSGYYEYDRSIVICDFETAGNLLLTEDRVSKIEISLLPQFTNQTEKIQSTLESELGDDYIVTAWTENNAGLFRLITLEKWLIFIVFSFLVLIAGLNVVSAVSTSIVDMSSEIAILRTVGAGTVTITRIIYSRIAVIGLFAVLIGQILGAGLSYLAIKQSIYTLKGDVYFIDKLTIFISPTNQIVIFFVAAVIILLCIRIPLRNIRNMQIIDVFRRN